MRHPLSTSRPAMPNDLHFPPHVFFDPLTSLPCIALIRPHFLQARKQVLNWLQEQLDALTILNISGMDNHLEHKPHCIYNHMSLASIELFGTIIAMWPTAIRRFH